MPLRPRVRWYAAEVHPIGTGRTPRFPFVVNRVVPPFRNYVVHPGVLVRDLVLRPVSGKDAASVAHLVKHAAHEHYLGKRGQK